MRLKELRLSKGVTQKEVANSICYSSNDYARDVVSKEAAFLIFRQLEGKITAERETVALLMAIFCFFV